MKSDLEAKGTGPAKGKRSDRRERMKAELWAAAFDGFLNHGIEATRIEDITDAVGVSRRTFFRYFSSKEDVLLHWFDHVGDLVCARLAERPADEGPFLAMRNSFKALDEAEPCIRHKRVVIGTLIDTSTTLRREMLLRHEGWEADIANVVARRLGRDSEDAIVRQAVSIAYNIFKTAARQSRMDADCRIAPHIDKGFDRLGEILDMG